MSALSLAISAFKAASTKRLIESLNTTSFDTEVGKKAANDKLSEAMEFNNHVQAAEQVARDQ